MCFEKEKNINIEQLINWFPYKVGKSSDISIEPPRSRKIPFFLDNILRFIAIKNIPIIRKPKEFTYNYSFLGEKKLKIDYYSKNIKYLYKGYIILDEITYAILESHYTNYEYFYIDDFVMENFKRREDLETPYLVREIEISSKYTKKSYGEKYTLSNLNTSISFEEKKQSSEKYTSYSAMKSIEAPKNCENKPFSLRFIDSFLTKK